MCRKIQLLFLNFSSSSISFSSPPVPNAFAELTGEGHLLGGLFLVVLEVHIGHMHWWAGLLLTGIQVFHHLVINCLFAGEAQVKQVFAFLEP